MPDWQRLRGRFIVLDGGEGCGKSTQAHRLHAFLHDRHGLPVSLLRDPGSTGIGEQVRRVLLDPANDAMAMRCEMLLYMAARAQMVQELIAPALDRGELVLCDRFISSTLAYQLGGDGLTREEIMAVAEVVVGGGGHEGTGSRRHEGTEARRHEGGEGGPVDTGAGNAAGAGAATQSSPAAADPALRASVPSCLRASRTLWPDLTLILDMPVEVSQARVRPKFVPLFGEEAGVPDPSKDRIEQRPLAYHRRVRQNYLDQAAWWPDRYRVIDASRDPDTVFADVLAALESAG